ncbi:MAG: phosphoglucosamine mutase [Gemmataceae bacterium]|nr:phosphoglucosamine mutase [Gemmataceae bacterium]
MGELGKLVVSVSGIRGIVGESLTAEVALRFARAYGLELNGRVLVGTDGRPSGEMLKNAVKAGLAAQKCLAVDVGVVATPTMGVAIVETGAAGGIQITASHNPAPYNGMKLFGSTGRVLPALEGEKVRDRFLQGDMPHAGWQESPTGECFPDAVSLHVKKVMQGVSAGLIQQANLRVFVDANGGAGGPISSGLLQALGVKAEILGGEADGNFAHEPEPNADNLRSIGPAVARAKVHVGFVLDPDADRLALFDEEGNFLGEELTLALAVWSRLSVQPGPVVINMSTSLVTEKVAEKFRQSCFRSPVGEANVVDRMLLEKAVIGGEGNGGVIDPRIGLVRDPFIGMALILELMAREKKSLGELAAQLEKFVIKKEKACLDTARIKGWYERVRGNFPDAKADTADGLRLSWPGKWVHLRPSNTEPIVRIIAESASEGESTQLCEECKRLAGNEPA